VANGAGNRRQAIKINLARRLGETILGRLRKTAQVSFIEE
jgi:hypothetical protein